MAPPTNSNESYCTFTLASDVTAGGLPSEDEIRKDLESTDDNVSCSKNATQAQWLADQRMPLATTVSQSAWSSDGGYWIAGRV